MRRWLTENSLSLFFFVLLAGAVIGQAVAGHSVYNDEATSHDQPTVSFGRYVLSSHFGQALLENWQSEYLQFALLILATIWFFQRGSNESPTEPGRESDQKQKLGGYADEGAAKWAKLPGGFRRWLYSWSLLLVMTAIWIASWFGQFVTGLTQENNDRQAHEEAQLSRSEYLTSAQFWEDTLQNWQSEFLAVGSMAVFTIWLRARGSAESKPVGDSHYKTSEGG